MPVLSTRNLSVFFGDECIFSNVTIEAPDNARIGIIGPNGGGKTSLLKVITGELEPASGSFHVTRGTRIGYVPQGVSSTVGGSLREEVFSAFLELQHLERAMESSAMDMARLAGEERKQANQKYATLVERFDSLGGYDYVNAVERVTTGIGLSSRSLDTPFVQASGGERARATLARALLSDPDLLILDEPTNYLDISGLTWLERFLARFNHAFIVVSHDRYFLDKMVSTIWEIESGSVNTFKGNYSSYRNQQNELLIRRQREYQRQQEFIAKEQNFIERYRAGQRAREARGRATRLAKLKRQEAPPGSEKIAMPSFTSNRTGQVVVTTQDLNIGYRTQDSKVSLLQVQNLSLERGSRTAIVGSNGVGKSSFLRTIQGLIPPLEGKASLGHNVTVGYYHQTHEDLPNDDSVLDTIMGANPELTLEQSRSYLARFLFRGEDVLDKVSSLSGGERSRLALAKLMVNQPNVLLLDEPTTHLDINSRVALEQALQSYDGTLLFVSHDRQLISSLSNQILIMADGRVQLFKGTFQEWLSNNEPLEEKHRQVNAKNRPPQGRQKQQPKRSSKDNYSVEVEQLEVRLSEIEQQLQQASEQQDIDSVTRLGKDHNETQRLLDLTWQKWLDQ